MKLYLFGGASVDNNHIIQQLKLIEKVIRENNPKQVLYLPFARSPETEIARGEDWFIKNVNLDGIEYLNAKSSKDIAKAKNPFIIIMGGGQTKNLLQKIHESETLQKLIYKAEYIIGESAGAIVLAEFVRIEGNIIPGLGIIKNTIIEVHYTQRQRQSLLKKEMEETGVHYGVGIDEITGIEFELKNFPQEYKKIGEGNIEIKQKVG
ncbi:MAG TPA: Type 1 glutamine amidotransferase-like domain-containing protein [Candidatus Absconditabacterales bacterium]|nr:Type 1 glutamine amidotransferase-like domain-containing protein [Candidatus Absconditabacterales bacterium]